MLLTLACAGLSGHLGSGPADGLRQVPIEGAMVADRSSVVESRSIDDRNSAIGELKWIR
jgi:hypothetical protein